MSAGRQIKFKEVPGRAFSMVDISENDRPHFIGMVDWSPGRVFGLAVGGYVGTIKRFAIFFAGGAPIL